MTFDKRARIGRLHMKAEMRDSKNPWGRFGGGWNWSLGVQVGGRTIILNLFVFILRFDWRKGDE